MQERLEQRLQELKVEFDKGEQTLRELEEQSATVRQTLLRISGAIQVLEEMLDSPNQTDENGCVPSAGETANGAVKTLDTAR